MVYRIEIFTNQGFNPRSYAIIQDLNISFDYLTLESTKVICKSIDAEQGDWCRIVAQDGSIKYEGIIDSIVVNERTTELSIAPLLSLLNINSRFQYQRKGERFASAEACLYFLFYYNYIGTMDDDREIPFSYVHPTSTACPIIPTPTSKLNSCWNVATYLLKESGVVCDISLDIENKRIVITNQAIENQIVIETDKSYVLKYEMSEGSNQGYNSVSIYSDDDSLTHQGTYVLHSDGTIDTDTSSDRISPVVFGDETAQVGNDESGQSYALAKATEVLQQGKWVNEIKVTIANNNKVIDANSPIGTRAIVIVDEAAYETILTGYIKKEKTTELLFGTIRSELTKQMAINKIATGTAFGGGSGGGSSVEEWSTDHETIVGKWVNGKNIYRKCAYRGNIGSGSTSMTFALDNPETIIFVGGCGNEGTGMSYAQYQLPYENPVDSRYSLGMFYRSGAVNFRGGSAVAIKNAYVWVDYTKTTEV